ncbi:MAG: ABC transporter ATP-binding protein [Rhodospirillales bacterium]|nr:ABC transporter ATP-binding protein [Rhodospirillales bacterium]
MIATEPLLRVERLIKRFGGLVATDAVDLDIMPGEVHALIGPNGAGKTTFIGQLSGELRPDSGRILLGNRDITRLPPHRRSHLGLARSFQITSVFPDFSVLDNVALAVQAHAGHSFRFWKDAALDTALGEPAAAILRDLQLDSRMASLASTLSYGERRQLELAVALASRPKLLLLDEPTAGMGPEESQRLIERLKALRGRFGILLVEHDMETVFALADRITVLESGRVLASGDPAAIRNNADVRAAYLGDDDAQA